MRRLVLLSLVVIPVACGGSQQVGGRAVFAPVPPEDSVTIPSNDRCADDTSLDAPGTEDDAGGPDSGDPPFTLAASSSSFVVPQGGSMDLPVSIIRETGFIEPVVVSVDGLPHGVTATDLEIGQHDTAGSITLSAPDSIAVPRWNAVRVRGHVSAGTRSELVKVVVRGATSDLDASFGLNGFVSALTSIADVEEQPDGKLLLTGQPGYAEVASVCRLEPDGSPDLSFGASNGCVEVAVGPGATGVRLALAGNRILLLGSTHRYSFFVARLSTEGHIDTSFGSHGVTEISTEDYFYGAAMRVIDGKAVVAGTVGDGGMRRAVLARFSENGMADPSFATGLTGDTILATISDLTVRDNCGFAISAGSELRAFNANGSPDLGFGLNGVLTLPMPPSTLTRTGDGAILSAGPGMEVLRISREGALEADYGSLHPGPASDGWGQTADASRIVLDHDGEIVLGGRVSSDEERFGIGRRFGDGNADPAFGHGGVRTYDVVGGAYDVVVLRDGRYLLGGSTSSGSGVLLRAWN